MVAATMSSIYCGIPMGKQRRLLDEYHFPGFRPRSEIQGIFGDPCAWVIRLKRIKKNDLRVLRYGTSEPLRQESAAGTRSVLWECPDILGSGGTESQVQEVRDGETRKTALAGEHSFLLQTVGRGPQTCCGKIISRQDL